MATGNDLLRMVNSEEFGYIRNGGGFRSMLFFDKEGKSSPFGEIVADKHFCHVRLIFQDIKSITAEVFAKTMQRLASTSSEHMTYKVIECYGFTEIIIM